MLLNNPAAVSARTARLIVAALVIGGVTMSASLSNATEKADGRINKKMEKSEVQIIAIDGKEKMEIAGVKDPAKIEVRKSNGVKTIRIWDRKGKLVTENAYDEGDPTPYDAIIVTSADGGAQTIDLTKSPEPPLPPEPFDMTSQEGAKTFVFEKDGPDGEKRAHKIVIKRMDAEQMQHAECRGDRDKTEVLEIETVEGKEHRKEIICLKTDVAGARADGLRAAIKQLEAEGALEAAHRENTIARLKEELAKAEQEAAQDAKK